MYFIWWRVLASGSMWICVRAKVLAFVALFSTPINPKHSGRAMAWQLPCLLIMTNIYGNKAASDSAVSKRVLSGRAPNADRPWKPSSGEGKAFLFHLSLAVSRLESVLQRLARGLGRPEDVPRTSVSSWLVHQHWLTQG